MSQGKVLTFVNKRVNMKLVRIALDMWEVLAVMDQRGRCQVLDFLDGRSPRNASCSGSCGPVFPSRDRQCTTRTSASRSAKGSLSFAVNRRGRS